MKESIKGPGRVRQTPRQYSEESIEAMMRQFPEELHEKIEERIGGKSLEEQALMLSDMLRRRREALTYTSKRLVRAERIPDKVIERFEKGDHQREVGRGDNGRVFEYVPAEEEGGGTVVFKMLIRPPLHFQNNLFSEGAYQADIAAFADAQRETRVGVPHPYYIAESPRGAVLAMEKLPGHSIEDIFEHNIRLPDNFDYVELERCLSEFIRRMNAAGFYHRDLREGNILVVPSPGKDELVAYVIDFGFCRHANTEADAYRDLDSLRDNVMIPKVMDKLRTKQELLRLQGDS